ncbi:GTPase Era [Candidatus Latescibacterota bacterium]
MDDTSAQKHKCGYVSIVGLPNAGKSTLVNRFFNEKISIVTAKPQTTRSNLTCILTSDTSQVIFVDTPGILKPKYKMQEVMASSVANAVRDADLLLVIYDVTTYKGNFHRRLVAFAESISRENVVVVLNKIDLLKKNKLLAIMSRMAELFPDAELFPVSALQGDGTDGLLDVIVEKLPEGPPLYPDDIISDEPERFFVSEMIRESIFQVMEQEIPYSTAVMVESFEEKEQGVSILATILIEKKSQKPIIIGKGGMMMKKIGTAARLRIEVFLGRKVYLELFVKIRDDWRNKESVLRELGMIKQK